MISALVILAAQAIAFQEPEAGARWQVVASEEGQFTVEMPGPPNDNRTMTRPGPNGDLRVVMTGCRTWTGSYLAYRVMIPTAIVRGAENTQLDAERNWLAKEYNGKVYNEKSVRLGSRVGRDFIVRGDKPGIGLVTVRARVFPAGRAVYVLFVVSIANRELPEDAGRFLGSLKLGLSPPGEAEATPGTAIPEPEGRPVKDWGRAIDPDGDCTITRQGKKALTMKLPDTLHDLNSDIRKLNAPRVVRDVEGDFVALVKVTGDFKPGGTPLNPKSYPYNGAGLLLWHDGDNFIRLERSAMLEKGQVVTFSDFEEREGGHLGAVHNGPLGEGTAYLRLERRGNRILGAVSNDGSDWTKLAPIAITWPVKLELGLAAINSNSEPFEVRFEEFSVKGK